jgi:hypothetical protein
LIISILTAKNTKQAQKTKSFSVIPNHLDWETKAATHPGMKDDVAQ